jgi:hypothetical protein
MGENVPAITWADVVKGTIGTKEEKQSSRNKKCFGIIISKQSS